MSAPVRREIPLKSVEIIAHGEITIQQGKSSFLFPGNSQTNGLIAKLKHVEDPNCYPNCAPSPDFKDEVEVYPVSDGFRVEYSIDSHSRVLEWQLVEYTK
jgi:hypothetical protein